MIMNTFLFQLLDAILSFIEDIYPILQSTMGCLIALLFFKIAEDSAEKNVSIISTIWNPKLYYLSLIYKYGKGMHLRGTKDEEIQQELIQKYKAKTLPFMEYPITKKKNIEAVEFVGQILEDKELLFAYVLTPSFGKEAYKKLIEDYNDDAKIREAKNLISKYLIENTPDKVDECFQWLPKLFYLPFVANETGCIQKQENMASVYYYLTDYSKNGKTEGNNQGTKIYFNSELKTRSYIILLEKLQIIFPMMVFSNSTSFADKKSLVLERKTERCRKMLAFIESEEMQIRKRKKS